MKLYWYLLGSFLLFEATDAFMQPRLFSPARARSSTSMLKKVRCSLQEKPPTIETKSSRTTIPMGPYGDLPDTSVENSETRMRLAEILKDDSIIDIAFHRLYDTALDISLHLSREASSIAHKDASQGVRKPKVVIAGSGWGAHALLKIIDTNVLDVVCVSPRSYFIFTPMLASASVGTVEYRSITEPMRSANPCVTYHEASITSIDSERKTIRCKPVFEGFETEFDLSYDYLVLGLGMKINTFGTPGVKEHCYFLKDINDAKRLRSAIIDKFESASLPNLTDDERRDRLSFVVVGGGPTGVEFSGEFFDFLNEDLKRYYPQLVPFVRTELIQAGDALLNQFDGTMQAMALRSLLSQGVKVLLNARVEEVSDKEIRYNIRNPDKTTTTITTKYSLCVWAAGNSPIELSKEFQKQNQPWKQDKRGRVVTDDWLRVVGIKDGSIFALGDCSESESVVLPQTAQVAAQQGAYLARIFNRQFRGPDKGLFPEQTYGAALALALRGRARDGDELAKTIIDDHRVFVRPFQFLSLGLLAYVGGRSAIAQVEVGMDSPQKTGTQMLRLSKQSGLAGWILWRSVYLTKQVAFRNRVLVLFDWMKSRVFGRDIACL
uniref:FAD/NAD(P)-binding domain-containing protein n=1 Tax=Hanusia phi TaxID=3032 RepID=A0A7S0HES5_9CRYP